MACNTTSGFCVVAALSRYTRGCPNTFVSRIGKSFRTFSTSNTPLSLTVTLSMIDRNMKTDKFVDMRFHFGYPDLLRHIKSESIDQKSFGRLLTDTPGPQVEQGFFAELSYG